MSNSIVTKVTTSNDKFLQDLDAALVKVKDQLYKALPDGTVGASGEAVTFTLNLTIE